MAEGILVVALLGLIAGGGIVVVDYLVIRHIRRARSGEPPTGD